MGTIEIRDGEIVKMSYSGVVVDCKRNRILRKEWKR